jgi:hypothetical protein
MERSRLESENQALLRRCQALQGRMPHEDVQRLKLALLDMAYMTQNAGKQGVDMSALVSVTANVEGPSSECGVVTAASFSSAKASDRSKRKQKQQTTVEDCYMETVVVNEAMLLPTGEYRRMVAEGALMNSFAMRRISDFSIKELRCLIKNMAEKSMELEYDFAKRTTILRKVVREFGAIKAHIETLYHHFAHILGSMTQCVDLRFMSTMRRLTKVVHAGIEDGRFLYPGAKDLRYVLDCLEGFLSDPENVKAIDDDIRERVMRIQGLGAVEEDRLRGVMDHIRNAQKEAERDGLDGGESSADEDDEAA